MKHDLFELLNEAIMTDISFLLVEGKDDPQIYTRIADKVQKNVDIYPVNVVEDYAAGCKDVLKAIEKLQPKFEERVDNINRVLGIIDRDSRPYRPIATDEPDYRVLKGLFVLKYYSIETYFATRTNLKKLIEKLTYATSSMVTEALINEVESNFNLIQNNLFYISLEALKNACVVNYNTILGYDDDSVQDNNRRASFSTSLIGKKENLDVFAQEKNVTINDLKLICKGKWFLYLYISQANLQIRTLETKCRQSQITPCDSCSFQDFNNCSYKYKRSYQIQAIYDDVFEYIDLDECKDIAEKIQALI